MAQAEYRIENNLQLIKEKTGFISIHNLEESTRAHKSIETIQNRNAIKKISHIVSTTVRRQFYKINIQKNAKVLAIPTGNMK